MAPTSSACRDLHLHHSFRARTASESSRQPSKFEPDLGPTSASKVPSFFHRAQSRVIRSWRRRSRHSSPPEPSPASRFAVRAASRAKPRKISPASGRARRVVWCGGAIRNPCGKPGRMRKDRCQRAASFHYRVAWVVDTGNCSNFGWAWFIHAFMVLPSYLSVALQSGASHAIT